MSAAANDRFDAVLGSVRGTSGADGALGVPGQAGAARGRELLSLIEAGALRDALGALARLGAVPGASEEYRGLRWPPEDVSVRAERRERERRWSKSTPSDIDAELEIDAAETVRRALAQQVAGEALRAWTPVFRELAHCIGYRRADIAEHVIRIAQTLHLFEPADVLLAGDRRFTQSMACGQSALQPGIDGLIAPVPRGLWREVYEAGWDYRDASERGRKVKAPELSVCRGCVQGSHSYRYEECMRESASDWAPLSSERWGWLSPNTASRVHQLLQCRPQMSERQLRELALCVCRERYLETLTSPMQQDDKPCLWYRAPALSEEESWEVNRRTYDRRIFNQPVKALLDAQCPASPEGFAAEDTWRRAWCERLLAHLRAAEEHNRR